MKRLLTIAAVLLITSLVVASNTEVASYVCTGLKLLAKQATPVVSPEFEVERLKLEIAKLDNEVPRMVNSLATMYKDDIEPLKAKVNQNQKKLKNHETVLLEFAKVVKGNNSPEFVFEKLTYTTSKANEKLTQDFAIYQSLKATVQGQEKLLAAKEKQYSVKLDQVAKIRLTKQEFETKLTQLETDLALLRSNQASGSATEADFDNERITLIQNGLKGLQREIGILQHTQTINDQIAPAAAKTSASPTPAIDPDVVLNAIQNPGEAKSSVNSVTPQQ